MAWDDAEEHDDGEARKHEDDHVWHLRWWAGVVCVSAFGVAVWLCACVPESLSVCRCVGLCCEKSMMKEKI